MLRERIGAAIDRLRDGWYRITAVRYLFYDFQSRMPLWRLGIYILALLLMIVVRCTAWLRIIQTGGEVGIVCIVIVFLMDLNQTRYIPGLMDWRTLRPTVRELHELLNKLHVLDALILKLENCDPEHVGEIVHTEWKTVGDDDWQELSMLLNGQGDVDVFLDFFTEKRASLLPPIAELTSEIAVWRHQNVIKSLLPDERRGRLRRIVPRRTGWKRRNCRKNPRQNRNLRRLLTAYRLSFDGIRLTGKSTKKSLQISVKCSMRMLNWFAWLTGIGWKFPAPM